MKHIVGVADMKMSSQSGDVIVTHALGSCLGVTAYDASACVGGMLHVMLPQSSLCIEKARNNPYMFVDSGLPSFFHALYAKGANKGRITVKTAGGASIQRTNSDHFAIGRRNYAMLRKLLWQNGMMIDAEDVGGSSARTMHLEIGTGRVWLSTGGVAKELAQGHGGQAVGTTMCPNGARMVGPTG